MRKSTLWLLIFMCLLLSSVVFQERCEATVRPSVMRIRDSQEPVILQSVEAKVEVVGRHAKTELQLVFFNPNHRVLEGELNFPLMGGQNIESFALEMEDGALREAVVVDKETGREAFDTVTRQRIDPALLERTEGNNFRLRVYPLNPQRTRRVVLRYSELLPQERGKALYRLPLDYVQSLDTFSFQAEVWGVSGQPVSKSGSMGPLKFRKTAGGFSAVMKKETVEAHELAGGVQFSFPLSGQQRVTTQLFRGQPYFYAELPRSLLGGVQERGLARLRTIGLLWDASGSAARRNRDAELALLQAVFDRHPNVNVELQVVRNAAEPMRKFTIKNGNWEKLRGALSEAPLDGATSLKAFRPSSYVDAYLFFTDGIDNFSAEDGTVLNFAAFKAPIYTVLSSPGSDAAVLRYIADKTGGGMADLTSQSPRAGASGLFVRRPVITGISAKGADNINVESGSLADGTIRVTGVLKADRAVITLNCVLPDGARKTLEVAVVGGCNAGSVAALEWARMRVDGLSPNYYKNRDAIRKIGRQFSLVTRDTSLIVLDRVEDYVRYRIEPPAELKAAYGRLISQGDTPADRPDRKQHLTELDRLWKEYCSWWQEDFPKDKPTKHDLELKTMGRGLGGTENYLFSSGRNESTSPASVKPHTIQAAQDSVQNTDAPAAESKPQVSAVSCGEYDVSVLKRAPSRDLYRVYCVERRNNADNPYFYLDAADVFRERKMDADALRVLSNLAEISLENRRLLRLLGERLMAYGRYKEAVMVYNQVRRIAGEEPQSYRDLAMAYEALGNSRQAADYLWHVASTPWDRRFQDISLTALVEMNRVISGGRLGVGALRIPAQYIREMPLDLRIVLTWDTDGTDVSLYVTDPNGEVSSNGRGWGRWARGRSSSYQGARTSLNFSQGYGPETYELKKAKPGTYGVKLYYSGNRTQFAVKYTTAAVRVYRNYGRANQTEEVFTVRLGENQAWQMIPVADIVIK